MDKYHSLEAGDRAYVPNNCYVSIQRRHSNLGAFSMHYDYALRKVADELGEAALTIVKLLTKVKVENQVYIRQSALARDFGISRVTLIRHLNKAKELGIIEPDPEEGGAIHNIHVWRICPFLTWKGDRNSLNKYLAALPPNHVWLTEWSETYNQGT